MAINPQSSVVMWRGFTFILTETKMTFTTDYTAEYSRPSWFERSETWLDRKGKGVWIAAMVLGFIFFWPVGLALLAYMIWSKKCLETNVVAHVQHISRRCAPQGTKPLMRISMTHWPVWPTNKKSFLPFLSVYATPKTAQSSMTFWKSATAKPKLTKKKRHNIIVAPTPGLHHFNLGSRICVSDRKSVV